MIWFNFICVQFSRKLFTLNTIKKNLLKIIYIKKFWFYLQRNDFYLPLLGKKNEFLQFYLQSISSLILI